MNASQVLAWFMCLLLAFCACLLGAFNMGRQRLLERDIEKIQQEVGNAGRQADQDRRAQIQRIRETLALVSKEIEELKAAEGQLPQDLGPRLQRLEELVGRLDGVLGEEERR